MTVHIITGWTARGLSWKICPQADFTCLSDDGMGLAAGPKTGTITLGSSRYEGALAGLSILRRSISEAEADCLFRDGETQVQSCATGEMLQQERSTAYYASLSDDQVSGATHLLGDAFIDRSFGVQLDGAGDYIHIDPMDWRHRYSGDGTFTIALWFSKQSECRYSSSFLGDRFETLFSHKADARSSEYSKTNSAVNIDIGCFQGGQHTTLGESDADRTCYEPDLTTPITSLCQCHETCGSCAMTGRGNSNNPANPSQWPVEADNCVTCADGKAITPGYRDGIGSCTGMSVIRTALTDGNGKQIVFDTDISSARGGNIVLDEWVHLVLSVDHRSVNMILDGTPVEIGDIGFPKDLCDGCEAWSQTPENLGYPDPRTLSSSLGGFSIVQQYGQDSYYNETVWLTPGQHTITTVDTGGPNKWHGGYWYVREATRAMTGSRHLMSEQDAPQDEALCNTLCSAAGFPFMGLQGSEECFCGNEYGARGEAPAEDCEADGEVVCGKGIDGVCMWRNAVYSTGDRTMYKGCYYDSQEDSETGDQVAEGVGGDSATITVDYPEGYFAFGPMCGTRYHDFDTFNQSVTLRAGTYYFHAGGRGPGRRSWAGAKDSCDYQRPAWGDANSYRCNDGTSCQGWRCCMNRRGVAQCPQSRPWMCANDNECDGNTDYCCERTEQACVEDHGGVRGCDIETIGQTYWEILVRFCIGPLFWAFILGATFCVRPLLGCFVHWATFSAAGLFGLGHFLHGATFCVRPLLGRIVHWATFLGH